MALTEEQSAKGRAVHKANAAARRRKDERDNIAELLNFNLPTDEDWRVLPLDYVKDLVDRIQLCYQQGAKHFNQRTYAENRQEFTCIVCEKRKPIYTEKGVPNYVWRDDRIDQKTGVMTTRMICSQTCFFRGGNSGKINQPGPEVTNRK